MCSKHTWRTENTKSCRARKSGSEEGTNIAGSKQIFDKPLMALSRRRGSASGRFSPKYPVLKPKTKHYLVLHILEKTKFYLSPQVFQTGQLKVIVRIKIHRSQGEVLSIVCLCLYKQTLKVSLCLVGIRAKKVTFIVQVLRPELSVSLTNQIFTGTYFVLF